jgi:hypothetical protein
MTETQNKIVTAFEAWTETINSQKFVMLTGDGELNAKDVLKEMKEGSAFGVNFLQSIEIFVYNVFPEGCNGMDCDFIDGNGGRSSFNDLVQRMEAVGSDFLEDRLKLVFESFERGLKKSEE